MLHIYYIKYSLPVTTIPIRLYLLVVVRGSWMGYLTPPLLGSGRECATGAFCFYAPRISLISIPISISWCLSSRPHLPSMDSIPSCFLHEALVFSILFILFLALRVTMPIFAMLSRIPYLSRNLLHQCCHHHLTTLPISSSIIGG